MDRLLTELMAATLGLAVCAGGLVGKRRNMAAEEIGEAFVGSSLAAILAFFFLNTITGVTPRSLSVAPWPLSLAIGGGVVLLSSLLQPVNRALVVTFLRLSPDAVPWYSRCLRWSGGTAVAVAATIAFTR